MAAVAKDAEASEVDADAEAQVPIPGGISVEELGTLYRAAKIELRALNEQIAERDRLLGGGNELLAAIMQALGVDQLDKVLPAIATLQKNRQARRSEKKQKQTPPRAGRRPTTGGKKP